MIQDYRFGEIVIDGRRYREDVLVFPTRVLPRWWRKEGHLLQLEDLKELLAERPEALVVGTGAQERMKVAAEVVSYTRGAAIELLAFDTRTACQMFNDLVDSRRVAAALHLTC